MPKRSRDEDTEEQSSKLARQSERDRRPPLNQWLAALDRKTTGKPNYVGHALKPAGSARVIAELGPLALNARANDANAKLPTGIKEAREKHKSAGFKAGHMLNCDLGGDGKNAKNLTILTARANTAMTKLDNRLKTAVENLRTLYEELYIARVSAEPDLRIEASISVSGAWGRDTPDSYICENLTIAANLKGSTSFKLGDQARSQTVRAALDRLKKELQKANGSIRNQ